MDISECSWAIAIQLKTYHLETQPEEEKSSVFYFLI